MVEHRKKIIAEFENMGFDWDCVKGDKYIFGRREKVSLDEKKTAYSELTVYSKAFWILFENDKIKLEYFKGQIFVEEYFEEIAIVVDYVKRNIQK